MSRNRGATYLSDSDADSDDARTLRPLQSAVCTRRCAAMPISTSGWSSYAATSANERAQRNATGQVVIKLMTVGAHSNNINGIGLNF